MILVLIVRFVCLCVLLLGDCLLSSSRKGLFVLCVFVESACCCFVGGGILVLL